MKKMEKKNYSFSIDQFITTRIESNFQFQFQVLIELLQRVSTILLTMSNSMDISYQVGIAYIEKEDIFRSQNNHVWIWQQSHFHSGKVNGENQVHKIFKQTWYKNKKENETWNATIPRAGNNHRCCCNCRYAPAHIRFNVKENLIIYLNTLKPYTQQLFLFVVKKTNNRSCIIVRC